MKKIKNVSELALQLHGYFKYRKHIYSEGVEYSGCPVCIEEALESGCKLFDGVIVFENEIIGDWYNPEAFLAWSSRPEMWISKKSIKCTRCFPH